MVVLSALRILYETSTRHSIDLIDGENIRYEPPPNNELSRRISVAGNYLSMLLIKEHVSWSYLSFLLKKKLPVSAYL